ncbi:hypothetical protein [Fundidesulfovibrio terrae]|uniref:hypothetical protein n=1 Tax=Fundidesulfovibrio terrae TaxID=2922866 RepID=UPI001FAF6BB7|nr:hypothetical protein [Fundidesulfovibrio terrae]
MNGVTMNERMLAILVAAGVVVYVLWINIAIMFRSKAKGRMPSPQGDDDGVEAGTSLRGWRRAAYELAVFLVATSLSFLMILLYRKLVHSGWFLG